MCLLQELYWNSSKLIFRLINIFISDCVLKRELRHVLILTTKQRIKSVIYTFLKNNNNQTQKCTKTLNFL